MLILHYNSWNHFIFTSFFENMSLLSSIVLAGFGRFFFGFWPVLAGFRGVFGRFQIFDLATLFVARSVVNALRGSLPRNFGLLFRIDSFVAYV